MRAFQYRGPGPTHLLDLSFCCLDLRSDMRGVKLSVILLGAWATLISLHFAVSHDDAAKPLCQAASHAD